MNAGFKDHIPEEVLEVYARGKLFDEDDALEEHLLTCCVCQERLQQIEEYIFLIKVAAASLVHGPASCFRRFIPEFRTAILRGALPLSSASTLADVGFGFTTLVALGRVFVNTAWTWNGIRPLG